MADERKLVIAVGYMLRYNPAIETAKALLKEVNTPSLHKNTTANWISLARHLNGGEGLCPPIAPDFSTFGVLISFPAYLPRQGDTEYNSISPATSMQGVSKN
jgi:hypothetical protein